MPKPAAVSDLDKFLSLLEKSTLLSSEKMAEVRATAAGHDDAKALARYLIKTGVVTKWQAMQLLAGWNAFRIDKYHLLSQVGSGEHSRMYLAEHRAMGRKVVLRTLPRRSAERPELLRRFLKEAQSASQLDHRNIIHVYDVNSEGDRYFVVMEYIDGRNVFDIVAEEGPLTPSKAADYIRQAAEGLDYAHGQGVIHRELSPGKLIVDQQGQLKILEMGISGLDEPSETASTDISGGPTSAGAYLAPEQCQAKPVADERADIYALGASLYYMLSGKSPLAPSAKPKPQDLLQLRSDIPVTLVELCQKMMASSSEGRFASAAELKAACEQWLAQQRPAAPPVRRKPAAPVEEVPPAPSAAKAAPPKAKPKVAKAIEEPIATPTVAETASFPAFDTSPAPRKGGKPSSTKAKTKKVAQPEPVAEADGEEAAEPIEQAKKGLPLGLLIGGAIGGVALLVVIGVVVAFAFMGGGEKQVAKNEGKDKAEQAAKEDDKKADVPEEESTTEEMPVDPPMVDPMPMPEEPVAPMPEPMPQPEPMEPVVPEPMPEPVPVEPKPEEPKPEPKPELKPEPKPEPKPMVEPFVEVAKAVDLPSLGLPTKPNPMATDVVSLGVVKLEPDGVVFMRLLGGEKATAGKSTLTLATVGNEQHAWEITAADAKAGSTVIAKLALKDGDLSFQWTPEATQNPPTYAGLINCALDLAAGPKSHRVSLRKPIEASPLAVNLERAVVKNEIDIPFAPDPSAVKFEILKVEGGVKATSDKTQFPAAKDSAFITFGDKPEEQLLMMKVDSLLKQKLTLSLTPHVKTDVGPQKFTLKQFNLQKLQVTGQQQQVFAGIESMRKAKRPQAQIDAAEKQMETLNEAVAKITAAEAQLQAISTAQIQYRVYYEPADGEQIDLVTTNSAGPAGNIPPGDDAPKLNLGNPDE